MILTQRQAEILETIIHTVEERGFQPSIRELCDKFGISGPNAIVGHLKALEKKGLIRFAEKDKARCIELVGIRFQRIEVVGVKLARLEAQR